MTTDLSFLPRDPARVDEVKQDVEIIESDTEIHYVVDPFEIVTFCFPAQRVGSSSWDEIIHNVIALYEVFYGHHQHPILLDEYNYELIGNIRYWQRQVEEGLEAAEKLRQAVGDPDDLKTGRDFTATLAVALGVLSEGFTRLKDLLTTRLGNETIHPQSDETVLRNCFSENRNAPDVAIDIAVGSFQAIVDDYQANGRPMPERFRQRHRNSIIVDSQAVCRLLKIQEAALHAFEHAPPDASRRLEKRHLFYYVSSAERTESLFKILEKKRLLPYVNDRPFSAWRTPRQILLRLICTGRDKSETLHRLDKIRDIVKVVRDQGTSDLNAQMLPNELRKQLSAYQSSITEHYERVQNFGLASLLSTSAHLHELLQERSDADWVQKARDLIRERIEQPEWKEKARELVNLNLFFTEAKVLTDSLLRNLASQEQSSPNERHAARSGRDPVAGSRHHLPTVFRAEPEGYESILSKIKLYFLTPIHGRSGQGKMIGRACAAFLEKDRTAQGLGADQIGHEFVRNLLFLALPPVDADRFALDHADEIIDRISDLLSEESDTEVRRSLEIYEREFRYLGCWAARRQADYKKGAEWTDRAIEAYAEDPDPRFFHARCLNTYAWISDFKKLGISSKPPKRLSIRQAIDDALKAVPIYTSWGGEAKEQAGVLYNTVACLFVYGLDDLYDVESARVHLDLLKAEIDKSRWLDRFPEYFHTEALVEFEEFKSMREDGRNTRELLDKLENARREIELAFDMYKETPHAKHRDEVEVLRSQILDAIQDCKAALAD